MPLLPPVLAQGLIKLDEPSAPQSPSEVAQKWFDAWWAYASGMVFLNPGTLAGAKATVQGLFIGILTPGAIPNPVPLTFFLALEGAMRASWAVLGTPLFLTPPLLAAIPAPVPLTPLLLAVVPVGLVSPIKPPPRILMATIIDVWTRTHIVNGPSGPVGPFT